MSSVSSVYRSSRREREGRMAERYVVRSGQGESPLPKENMENVENVKTVERRNVQSVLK